MRQRPPEVLVFFALSIASCLLMLFLGTMAWAYFVPVIYLAAIAILLWTDWKPQVLTGLLAANQISSIVLILIIFYRRTMQPAETFTLDVASLALIANMLLGGPALSLLSIPLLALRTPATMWPSWLTLRKA